MIQYLAISAIPIIFAITLHEAAHGYAALRFGDKTAWQLGRISLNPVRHIDPLGTLVIPVVTYLLGGFMFGWAKPVPVNFSRLRNPKKDMFWVALAGPAANLFMALAWAIFWKLSESLPLNTFSLPMIKMADAGIHWNVVLMVLNLMPLLPLDGGRIVVSLLPPLWAWRLSQYERWGFFILVILLATGILGAIIGPIIVLIRSLIAVVFQFHF